MPRPAGRRVLLHGAGQEDFQAFVPLAAGKLGGLLDNLELLIASELLAAAQARHLRGAPLSEPLEAAIERFGIAPVDADRPFTADVDRIRALLR